MWEAHFQPDFISGYGHWVYIWVELLPTWVKLDRSAQVTAGILLQKANTRYLIGRWPTGFP